VPRAAGAPGAPGGVAFTRLPSDQIPIRWASSAEDLAGALAVREEVFCGEQGVTIEEEHDGLDADALHLLALDPTRDEAVGTLRLRLLDGEARIGRVAVRRAWRRRGIALRMLSLALERALAEGCGRALLAAQLEALALYEQAGFSVESEPFEEARIIHVWMGRGLGEKG
jgi:predicted GNAT family N-acyltransferase